MTKTGDLQQVQPADIRQLAAAALKSERKRSHLLLHESHADSVQRLLVFLRQGSYIQPHRHSSQWEMIVPLDGVMGLLLFSDDGAVTRRVEIRPGDTSLLQIPAGVWHTLFSVSDEALLLEIKPGPFRPAEFAGWCPGETEPESQSVVNWIPQARMGERWRSAAPA
jgi:cupin fold WbuC family metalloprotein